MQTRRKERHYIYSNNIVVTPIYPAGYLIQKHFIHNVSKVNILK